MDSSTILSFTLIAFLLVISPGPNGVLITKTVPTSGKSAGFANVAGFVVAFYVHGALSILGLSLILLQSAQAFILVKLLGAAYLCWIGAKALMNAFKHEVFDQNLSDNAQRRSLGSAFLEGFLTNVLNPKVSMFYLAAFPQFISQSQGALGASFALVVIHSLLNLFWFSAMVMLLSRLSGFTRNDLIQRLIKCVTGVVFIGFGAKLATFER